MLVDPVVADPSDCFDWVVGMPCRAVRGLCALYVSIVGRRGVRSSPSSFVPGAPAPPGTKSARGGASDVADSAAGPAAKPVCGGAMGDIGSSDIQNNNCQPYFGHQSNSLSVCVEIHQIRPVRLTAT
jgi:hypothetical protein